MLTTLLLAGSALAQAPMSSDELEAILTFRAEHLSIRELKRVIPGHVTVMNSGWGWGRRPWRGYTWDTDVITSPPEVLESWAVYRGPQRLSVPEYAETVGRAVDATDLERRIRHNSGVGNTFGGLAVVGLAAGATGLVGSFVDEPRDREEWMTVSVTGLGTAILSGIVSSATKTRADTLATDFPKTQALETAQTEVREYNEQLRQELGLTPGQAYRELAPPRRGQAAADPQ
jgi:hypothetical protein